jgi:hypothetical protein
VMVNNSSFIIKTNNHLNWTHWIQQRPRKWRWKCSSWLGRGTQMKSVNRFLFRFHRNLFWLVMQFFLKFWWHFIVNLVISSDKGKRYGVERHFKQYFCYIVEVNLIDGGNRSIWRKSPTCRKSLTNFIT